MKNRLSGNQKAGVAILALALLAVLVLLVSTAYLPASQPNQREKAYKIGFMGPFTGDTALFGGFMQNGLDLALQDLSESERSKIQIIKEDDQCIGKIALTAAQKLIEIDKVKYIIGPLCNETILTTESLFEDNNIVSITIGLPSNKIANMGPYHFSFSPEIEYLMAKISGKIRADGIRNVAVIHIEAPFEKENDEKFVAHFTQDGGRVVIDEAAVRGTTDFRSSITKIKDSNPEAIMIIAHSNHLANILKQLKEFGLDKLPKYGIQAAEAPSTLEVSDAAEGLIYPYPAGKNPTPTSIRYAEEYKAKYKLDTTFYSANTYDSLNVLLKSIEACGYENSSCVQEKIAGMREYDSTSGILSLDSRGIGAYKDIQLKVVRNGVFQKLE